MTSLQLNNLLELAISQLNSELRGLSIISKNSTLSMTHFLRFSVANHFCGYKTGESENYHKTKCLSPDFHTVVLPTENTFRLVSIFIFGFPYYQVQLHGNIRQLFANESKVVTYISR